MARKVGRWLLACAMAMPSALHAQTVNGPFLDPELPFDVSRGENTSVLERARPEYEAAGINAGGFTYFPRVRVGGGYSDNVYGNETVREGDVFGALDPSIDIVSNWSRHALTFGAGVELRRFADETPKDETRLFVVTNGRLDLGDSAIEGGARVRRLYESQYSGAFPTTLGASIPFVQSTLNLRGTYQGSRLRLIGFGDVNRFDFSDGLQIDGTRIDQGGRNRLASRGGARVEYALTPSTAFFVQGTYLDTEYERAQALFGLPNRDSKEYRILGGGTFDLTALVRGSIGLGYVRRNFQSDIYGSISGFAGEARVEYFPTELTTVTLIGRRTIEDAVSPGSGGYFATVGGLRVDHELRRNVLLNIEGAYERDRFDRISRRDEAWRVGVGADYLINRRVGFSLGASYADRDSRGEPLGLNFDEFRATASVLYQL